MWLSLIDFIFSTFTSRDVRKYKIELGTENLMKGIKMKKNKTKVSKVLFQIKYCQVIRDCL
jgi:hypothetical protein